MVATGKKKILYMDDYSDTLLTFTEILQSGGYTVTPVKTSKEFLEALAKEDYDLILLDMMMPETSGWDIFTEITKADNKYKGKVVFFSVLEASEERIEIFKRIGVADYIQKPIDREDLLSRIKKILA